MSLTPPLSLQESKWRVELTNASRCAVVLSTVLPTSGCQKFSQSTSEHVQSFFNYSGAFEAGRLLLFHNAYHELNAKRCS